MTWVATAVAGSSIISGVIGANAASDAASQQTAAANRATDINYQMFNTINSQQQPWRQAGQSALSSMVGGLGLGPTSGGVDSGYFTHAFNANDLNANLAPNYDFMLNQGLGAVKNFATTTGGLIGGNTLKAISDYTTNYAKNAYQDAFNNFNTNQTNIFNRLASVSGLGQTATNNTGTAGATIAGNTGNAAIEAGRAQASGTVGAANALTGGMNNAMSWYALPSLLNYGNTGGNASFIQDMVPGQYSTGNPQYG